MSLFICFLSAVLSCLGNVNHCCDEWRRDTAVLMKAGDRHYRENLVMCLRTPAAEELREIPTWMERLGDDEFEVREQASLTLFRMGRAARPSLQQGLSSADPEVRRRCADCLEEMDNLETQIVQHLRSALAQKLAYGQQIPALREQEKACSKHPELIRDAEAFLRESERDAESAERILRRWGLSSEELEQIKGGK